jgi:predicted nucleic acid-binding protein
VNWYFDSSVLVSAAVAHHPHNARALEALEQLPSGKHRGHTSAHTLTEVYSVLTRTPFRPPLFPHEAWQIIEAMILAHLELVTLAAKDYREVVRQCAASSWSGGRVHDAVHLRCAQKANCDRIYTFNVKDFRTLAARELQDKISAP